MCFRMQSDAYFVANEGIVAVLARTHRFWNGGFDGQLEHIVASHPAEVAQIRRAAGDGGCHAFLFSDQVR